MWIFFVCVKLVCRCGEVHLFLFFFFKQKTAYEMRISDWSSDVCSSDLIPGYASRRWNRPGSFLRRNHRKCTWPDRCRSAWYGEIGRASCRERVCQYV